MKLLDVETPVLVHKLNQIDGGQVAGSIVQKHILTAGITAVNAATNLACVPPVDGGVVLHPGVGAPPSRLGYLMHDLLGRVGVDHSTAQHFVGVPLTAG